MPKIKLHLSIGFPSATRQEVDEIDDELWKSMNETEREDLLNEIASDWANNFINYSAWVVE